MAMDDEFDRAYARLLSARSKPRLSRELSEAPPARAVSVASGSTSSAVAAGDELVRDAQQPRDVSEQRERATSAQREASTTPSKSRLSSAHPALDILARRSQSQTMKGKQRAQPSSHSDKRKRKEPSPRNILGSQPTYAPTTGEQLYNSAGQPVMIHPMTYPGISASVTISQPQYFPHYTPSPAPPYYAPNQPPFFNGAASYSAAAPYRPETSGVPMFTGTPSLGSPYLSGMGSLYAPSNRIPYTPSPGPAFARASSTGPVYATPYTSAVGEQTSQSKVNSSTKSEKKPRKKYTRKLVHANEQKDPVKDREQSKEPAANLSPVKLPLEPRVKLEVEMQPTYKAAETGPILIPKVEPGYEPASAPKPESSLEGVKCFPIATQTAKPNYAETHTLFVHHFRRQAWMIQQAARDPKEKARMPIIDDQSLAWVYWSTTLGYPAFSPLDTVAQCDANAQTVGPMPNKEPFAKEGKEAYRALQKSQFSARRMPRARLSISRLLRYAEQQSAITEDDSAETLRHERLVRKAYKQRRPPALDPRQMWLVWANAAHSTRRSDVAFPLMESGSQRDKSRTPSSNGEVVKRGVPSSELVRLSTPSIAEEAEVEADLLGEHKKRTRLPFLRRNLRLFAKLGYSPPDLTVDDDADTDTGEINADITSDTQHD